MKNKILLLVLLMCVNAFLPPTVHKKVFANTVTSLPSHLNELISTEPQLNGGLIGISIRSGQTGDLLYDYHGNTRLTPASNLKLLTAATALEVLGPKHCLTTEVMINGQVEHGVLKGDLYLKGGGDPTLHYSHLQSFASSVKKYGIHTIQGKVIGDDTRYDGVRYSIDMPWSDEETYYGAEISALTLSPNADYDAGTVIIEIRPGKRSGDSTSYKVIPHNHYISISNQSITGSKEDKQELTFTRQHGSNKIIITGVIPIDSPKERQWMAVYNASAYTTNLFTEALEQQGIVIEGGVTLGKTPVTSTTIVSHNSMPLSKLMVPFMKQSNNGHAEILVKELGKKVYQEGSFEKGLQVINQTLPLFRVDPSLQVIRDGSGISHVNAIRPNDVTMLLYHVKKRNWFPSYYASLPVAGFKEKNVGGTLKNRMQGPTIAGKIIAKTGTLATVSSISGYAITKKNGTFIFSIMMNHVLDEESAKHVEDRILEVLTNQY